MANQAVVGVLRTLLTADTAQFDTSMRKVSQTVVKFGQETIKLTAQGEKMAAAFGGGKLLASANQLTGAITKLGGAQGLLGGAAKLTGAEQQRVNARVTEAIAKYRALGQTAPASMLALQKATQQAEVSTSRWRSTLNSANTVLGAFGITLGAAAFVNFGKQLLALGDQIVKVADRTNLAIEEVQRLQFIAEQSGNSIDEFTSAIGQLQVRLGSNNTGALKALHDLGIGLNDIRNASPFEQLSMIAKAMKDVEDPTRRAQLQVALFGRQGLAILPTMIAEFERLGRSAPVMSEATVRALDDIGDALNLLGRQFLAFAAEALVTTSRRFEDFIISIRGGLAGIADAQARWFQLLSRLPLVGSMYAELAKRFREFAQSQRDAASAHTQMLERQNTQVKKTTGAFVDYEAILDRSTTTTSRATGETSKLLTVQEQYFGIMARGLPVVQDNAAALGAYNLVVTSSIDDVFRRAEAERELNKVLAERGMLKAPSIEDNQASQEAAEITRQQSEEAAEIISQQIEELREQWRQFFADIGDQITRSIAMPISDALSMGILGMDEFKDAWERIWLNIRRNFQQVLASMLDEFINSFLKGMLKAIGATRLGERLAGLLTGTAGGVGPGALAQMAGGALPGLAGGAAGAGAFTTVNAAGVAVTPGLAAAGTPIAPGAAAGGGAGGLGFLSNPAFWTNPWTIGVGAGIALAVAIKKGLFRGGEEALEVNPRRDQFLSQFGNPADKGVGGGGHNLAAILTRLTGMPGGGPLFRSLQMADSVKEFVAAQSAVIGQLAKGGIRNIRPFNMGGFVPPGAVQLAMLHGGNFGELVTPLRAPMAQTGGHVANSFHFTIQTIDTDGVKQFLERDFAPWFKRETILNQHGVASSIRRVGQP